MTRRGMGVLSALVIGTAVGAWCAFAADEHAPPDLTGQWKLDARRSDAPPMAGPPGGGQGERGSGEGGGGGGWGGGGRHGGRGGGMGGGGGWGGGGRGGGGGGWGGGRGGGGSAGRGGGGGPDASGGAMRPVRLPDLMHVTQTLDIVSFEDSTGKVLQEIGLMDPKADTLMHSPGAMVLHGQWQGDTLDVERDSPRGKAIQGYYLQDDGKTLVIHTLINTSSNENVIEFKRVYHRVTES
ncbi:MAG TPA: hypothetical protein VLV15_03895 [Dongiaceae bacterium]|nr:hypothetical protein [Dongiaceae bacterium]